MSNPQLSMSSTLVNLRSKAFRCVELPANFGQYSFQEINAHYEQSILDLPRPLVNEVSYGKFSQVNPPIVSSLPARPVMPNTSQGLEGGPRICALLHDRMVYIKSLIAEIYHLQDLLHEAMGGFDTEDIDPCDTVGLNLADPSQQLNPLAAYFLRALVRMRMSAVDFQIVTNDIETILGTIAQINRGLLVPGVRMSRREKAELEMQYRAWEAVHMDIQLEWFTMCNGLSSRNIFHRDLKRRREFKQWQNGYRV